MTPATHHPSGPRLRTAVLAVSVLAVAAAATLPATALAAAPRPAGDVSATLVLRTPDQAAVGALAVAGKMSRSARMARLAATLPSGQLLTDTKAVAASLGLHVDRTTSWTVQVHGTAAAVARLTASGSSAGGGVTESPSLAPDVASVISGGPTGVYHPRALHPLSGPDFRAAYDASSAAPTGGNAPVIATLQFAAWNPTDLASYAAAAGLPAPSASTYTGINADSGAPTAITGDALEPAIDQESIYSVDPYALQRVYFAMNNQQGYVDALDAVAQDAVTGSSIMALSTSWGACEPDEVQALTTLMHNAIANVVAAGVTVFAASGDSGSDDCGSGNTAANTVDYPASDPLVVAVGGTQLDTVGPVETAWGAPGTSGATPDVFVGSGGGMSALWPRPAYQALVAPTSASREVPDIAADAAGPSGFPVYFNGSSHVAYGTSLAAPVSAALLTAELGSRGIVNGGVGDIHAALYAAPATSFRDITSGTNGTYNAAAGYDMVTGLGAPNWHAIVDQLVVAPVVTVPALTNNRTVPVTVTVPGGQTVVGWATGSGTPPACGNDTGKPTTPAAVTVPADGTYTIWAMGYLGYQRCVVGVATTTVDTTGPALTVAAHAAVGSGHPVTYSWGVTDILSGVATVTETLVRNGKLVWTAQSNGPGSITRQSSLGSVYRFSVKATDKLGNASAASHEISIAFDDTSFHFSTGWSRTTSHAALGGSLVRSVKKGASAHLSAYGAGFYLVSTTCSTCGILGVYVNGHHVRDLSLYSKTPHPQAVLKLATFSSTKVRSIVLLVRDTKVKASKGVAVSIDGLFTA